MDCREFEDKLSEYLDGELNGEERNLFEKHRRECTLCEMLLDGVSDNMALLGKAPEVEPPPDLAARILAATRPRRSVLDYLRDLFAVRPMRLQLFPRTASALLMSLFLAAVGVNLFMPSKPVATMGDARSRETFLLADDAFNTAFNTSIKVYRSVSDTWDSVVDTADKVGGFFQTKWEQVKDVFRSPDNKKPQEQKEEKKKDDRNGEDYRTPGTRSA